MSTPRTVDSEQSWARIARYLDRHGLTLETDPAPRQFSFGLANLNFLVSVDGGPMVLRRPPYGPVPKGAHDMAREYRVLSRLWREYPLAPRATHLCTDPAVAGAPFFLMEYRPGLVLDHRSSEGFGDKGEAVGALIEGHLIDVMVRLHRVDPRDVDLHALGNPDAFFTRQLRHWRGAAAHVDFPQTTCERIAAWLDDRAPPRGDASLIHNDFKVDNIAFDQESLLPTAVYDWDLCTRASPLFDLAVLLSYWEEVDDTAVMQALRQMPAGLSGFSTRDELIERYVRESYASLEGLSAYRVLALFRLAVIYAQLARSSRAERDDRYRNFGRIAPQLLEFALAEAMRLRGDRS